MSILSVFWKMQVFSVKAPFINLKAVCVLTYANNQYGLSQLVAAVATSKNANDRDMQLLPSEHQSLYEMVAHVQ